MRFSLFSGSLGSVSIEKPHIDGEYKAYYVYALIYSAPDLARMIIFHPGRMTSWLLPRPKGRHRCDVFMILFQSESMCAQSETKLHSLLHISYGSSLYFFWHKCFPPSLWAEELFSSLLRTILFSVGKAVGTKLRLTIITQRMSGNVVATFQTHNTCTHIRVLFFPEILPYRVLEINTFWCVCLLSPSNHNNATTRAAAE